MCLRSSSCTCIRFCERARTVSDWRRTSEFRSSSCLVLSRTSDSSVSASLRMASSASLRSCDICKCVCTRATSSRALMAPNLIFTLHLSSSLRFPELRLCRYRRSSRAPRERRTGCVFKDANCFELCHSLSGRASSWDGTNSASLRRQPHSQRFPRPLREPLFMMGSREERKWKR